MFLMEALSLLSTFLLNEAKKWKLVGITPRQKLESGGPVEFEKKSPKMYVAQDTVCQN
jgi:hypothetical protein